MIDLFVEQAKEDLQRLESSASAPAEDLEANRPGMEMTAKDLNRDLSWSEALQMVCVSRKLAKRAYYHHLSP
jgi:hypothetical protein